MSILERRDPYYCQFERGGMILLGKLERKLEPGLRRFFYVQSYASWSSSLKSESYLNGWSSQSRYFIGVTYQLMLNMTWVYCDGIEMYFGGCWINEKMFVRYNYSCVITDQKTDLKFIGPQCSVLHFHVMIWLWNTLRFVYKTYPEQDKGMALA